MGNRQFCEHCVEELEPCGLCKCHAKAVVCIIFAAGCAGGVEYFSRLGNQDYYYAAMIIMNVFFFTALYYCCGRSQIKDRYVINYDG